MVIKVEKKIDFEGEATAELLGLPANTSTKPEPLKFTKDSTELVFPIKIDQTAQARRVQDVGLPGGGDAEWRAGDAHAGNGRIAGRRTAAAQAGRAATRRATASLSPPAATRGGRTAKASEPIGTIAVGEDETEQEPGSRPLARVTDPALSRR